MDLQAASNQPGLRRRLTLLAMVLCFSLSGAILIATLASTRPLDRLNPIPPPTILDPN